MSSCDKLSALTDTVKRLPVVIVIEFYTYTLHVWLSQSTQNANFHIVFDKAVLTV